jgi:hypothetical protein
MERTSSTVDGWSVLLGLAALLVLALAGDVGGYFLLADSNGLFPSKAIFDLYKPALRIQRWATREPITAGYVDYQGRRILKRLP